MPEATLAAVVIVYSIGLIKPAEFRTILEVRRTEFVWALAALAGVVLLGTLQGILVAIVVSLILPRLPSGRPAGPRARAQAGHERLPTAFRGAPRGRDLPRVAPAPAGGADLLRERGAGRREDEAVDRRGEAEGRGAPSPRRVRSRVHGAQDVDGRREETSRETASSCGSSASTRECWRWSSVRPWARPWAAKGCSSIWSRPSPSIRLAGKGRGSLN